MYCKYCGKEVEENQDVCLNCGKFLHQNKKFNDINKSKMVAGLLGIFFGAVGAHNFYLGYKGKAIAQLLLTLLTCGLLSFVSAIWGLIEGVLILSGSINEDANGIPLE
jgi:TM2 domain-containing membrane protein YozV